jgi:hypothetical protein
MEIARGYIFSDPAGCGFARAATLLKPARSAEELLLGFSDRVTLDGALGFVGHEPH